MKAPFAKVQQFYAYIMKNQQTLQPQLSHLSQLIQQNISDIPAQLIQQFSDPESSFLFQNFRKFAQSDLINLRTLLQKQSSLPSLSSSIKLLGSQQSSKVNSPRTAMDSQLIKFRNFCNANKFKLLENQDFEKYLIQKCVFGQSMNQSTLILDFDKQWINLDDKGKFYFQSQMGKNQQYEEALMLVVDFRFSTEFERKFQENRLLKHFVATYGLHELQLEKLLSDKIVALFLEAFEVQDLEAIISCAEKFYNAHFQENCLQIKQQISQYVSKRILSMKLGLKPFDTNELQNHQIVKVRHQLESIHLEQVKEKCTHFMSHVTKFQCFDQMQSLSQNFSSYFQKLYYCYCKYDIMRHIQQKTKSLKQRKYKLSLDSNYEVVRQQIQTIMVTTSSIRPLLVQQKNNPILAFTFQNQETIFNIFTKQVNKYSDIRKSKQVIIQLIAELKNNLSKTINSKIVNLNQQKQQLKTNSTILQSQWQQFQRNIMNIQKYKNIKQQFDFSFFSKRSFEQEVINLFTSFIEQHNKVYNKHSLMINDQQQKQQQINNLKSNILLFVQSKISNLNQNKNSLDKSLLSLSIRITKHKALDMQIKELSGTELKVVKNNIDNIKRSIQRVDIQQKPFDDYLLLVSNQVLKIYELRQINERNDQMCGKIKQQISKEIQNLIQQNQLRLSQYQHMKQQSLFLTKLKGLQDQVINVKDSITSLSTINQNSELKSWDQITQNTKIIICQYQYLCDWQQIMQFRSDLLFEAFSLLQ